jgi:hypothetical protein
MPSMLSRRSAARHRFLAFALAAAAGCSSTESSPERSESPSSGSTAPPSATAAVEPVLQQGDTLPTSRVRVPRSPLLSDAEQQVADGITFAPRTSERFIVAARGQRLLLDIGRVDLELKGDADRLALVRRVSARVGPLARVDRVHVRGTWGEETDSIVGYDVWNGRAVAVLAPMPATDSLLRRNAPLVGVATRVAVQRADSTHGESAPMPCRRDSVGQVLIDRVAVVRDSLVRWVSDSVRSPLPRLAKAAVVRGDAAIGCFGSWRAVVVVTTRTPSLEWNEERALLVATDGGVATTRLRDLRLRAHESLVAFDADGDGVDEVAARGLASRMGAQSVLRLDPATRRLSRFASGFAWESR